MFNPFQASPFSMKKPMIEKSSKKPAEITYVDGQLVYFAEFVFVNYIILTVFSELISPFFIQICKN